MADRPAAGMDAACRVCRLPCQQCTQPPMAGRRRSGWRGAGGGGRLAPSSEGMGSPDTEQRTETAPPGGAPSRPLKVGLAPSRQERSPPRPEERRTHCEGEGGSGAAGGARGGEAGMPRPEATPGFTPCSQLQCRISRRSPPPARRRRPPPRVKTQQMAARRRRRPLRARCPRAAPPPHHCGAPGGFLRATAVGGTGARGALPGAQNDPLRLPAHGAVREGGGAVPAATDPAGDSSEACGGCEDAPPQHAAAPTQPAAPARLSAIAANDAGDNTAD
eukprot:scaffold15215_cov103-Isochrysis_galbana.AAC.2